MLIPYWRYTSRSMTVLPIALHPSDNFKRKRLLVSPYSLTNCFKLLPDSWAAFSFFSFLPVGVVAGALADAVAEQVPALKSHVCHYDYVVSAEGRGNFMDLQKAVDAVPVGKKAVIRILGGEWKKPIIAKGKKIKFVKSFGAKIK